MECRGGEDQDSTVDEGRDCQGYDDIQAREADRFPQALDGPVKGARFDQCGLR